MSELNLNDQPVFVSVETADTDPTFPILYTRLLQGSENENTEEAHISIVKLETPRQIPIETNVSVPETSQNTEESTETQHTEEKSKTVEPKSTSSTITQRISCPECKRYTTDSEEKMLRHLRVHRGENPFQCYVCDYSTYNKVVFEEHVRRHQGIKPFKCSKCDYCSASKKNTAKHELIHRPDNPLRCKKCDFIARNPQSLVHHNVKEHLQKNKATTNCKNCRKEFKSETKLKAHLTKKIKCDSCSHKTCNSELLLKHVINAHSKRKRSIKKRIKKSFTCAICEWGSNSKVRILLHLIHHPKQVVNEDEIDISVLRKYGIME